MKWMEFIVFILPFWFASNYSIEDEKKINFSKDRASFYPRKNKINFFVPIVELVNNVLSIEFTI
jgi:hypothetical protein